MTDTRLIVLRHGETTWNAQRRIQGRTDTELSREGHRQANELARRLIGEPVEAIYSSDLRRAVDTATPLAQRRALDIEQMPGLREWHMGIFEGLTYDQAKAKAGDDYQRFRRFEPGFKIPEGESYALFQERVVTAIEEIVQRHSGEQVAIFTHGGVMLALLRWVAGQALDAATLYKIPNGCITRLCCQEHEFKRTWSLVETEATSLDEVR